MSRDRPLASMEDAADANVVLEIVLAAWREVLRDPSLGPNADFFVNGGHSLLAVQIVSRVSSDTGLDIPLPFLFLHPTPAEFTQAVCELARGDSGA